MDGVNVTWYVRAMKYNVRTVRVLRVVWAIRGSNVFLKELKSASPRVKKKSSDIQINLIWFVYKNITVKVLGISTSTGSLLYCKSTGYQCQNSNTVCVFSPVSESV